MDVIKTSVREIRVFHLRKSGLPAGRPDRQGKRNDAVRVLFAGFPFYSRDATGHPGKVSPS